VVRGGVAEVDPRTVPAGINVEVTALDDPAADAGAQKILSREAQADARKRSVRSCGHGSSGWDGGKGGRQLWAGAERNRNMTSGRAGFPYALSLVACLKVFWPGASERVLAGRQLVWGRTWRPPFYGERRNGAGIFGIGPEC
jgi:hypothetical protein